MSFIGCFAHGYFGLTPDDRACLVTIAQVCGVNFVERGAPTVHNYEHWFSAPDQGSADANDALIRRVMLDVRRLEVEIVPGPPKEKRRRRPG